MPHPYAALRQIPDAQKLFERAARGDSSVSSDGEHIRPEMLQAAFGAVAGELAVTDLLLTDSATAGVPFKGEWDEGATFMAQLRSHAYGCWYKLMWGRKLNDMADLLKQYSYEYGDLGHIAIVIAGNDVYEGREVCAAALARVRAWGATVYSAIPPSTFEAAGEDPRECCPELYDPKTGDLDLNMHDRVIGESSPAAPTIDKSRRKPRVIGDLVLRAHKAFGCKCDICLPEVTSVSCDDGGGGVPQNTRVDRDVEKSDISQTTHSDCESDPSRQFHDVHACNVCV